MFPAPPRAMAKIRTQLLTLLLVFAGVATATTPCQPGSHGVLGAPPCFQVRKIILFSVYVVDFDCLPHSVLAVPTAQVSHAPLCIMVTVTD